MTAGDVICCIAGAALLVGFLLDMWLHILRRRKLDDAQHATNRASAKSPPWMANMTLIWMQEPGSVLTSELAVSSSWPRLFGEPEPLQPEAIWTAGRHEYRLYPLGRVARYSRDGAAAIFITVNQRRSTEHP